MKAVFADTFFLIAFMNTQDIAHERAKLFARSRCLGQSDNGRSPDRVSELFPGSGADFPRKAAQNVLSIIDNPSVRLWHEQRIPFREASLCTARALTRAIA